jgi:polyphosphate kinase
MGATSALTQAGGRTAITLTIYLAKDLNAGPYGAPCGFEASEREVRDVSSKGRKMKWPASDTGIEQDQKSPLKRKDYEGKLRNLHVKLVELQEWVRHEGKKVCIVFEGRDGAGKGGAIKAITARVSPRIFRVVALPAPTERERTQMYIQRYLPHLPSGGEVVIFDRSWYNRAGVERVMGFCTEDEAKRFLSVAPQVEKAMVDSGIILLKYWLEVSPKEQEQRLKTRIEDGRKIWKLSKMDLKSFTRWDDYTRARDEMFLATDTAWAPWFVARSDDKRRARLNIIEHLLANVPYECVPRARVKLPARQVTEGDRAPRLPLKIIAEVH